MKVILEVMEGPLAGERIVVEAGESVRVGKEPTLVDRAFPKDPQMSLAHFEVSCDAAGGQVRDLGSRAGTHVNRVRSNYASLKNGDIVTAGETLFRVRVLKPGESEGPARAPVSGATIAAGAAVLGVGAAMGVAAATAGAPEAPPAKPETPARRLLRMLREQPLPVFAIYDAARNPEVLEILGSAGADGQSLFEGPRAPELATVAPYLVGLPKDSKLLEDMLDKGWGQSWGVYLLSGESFQRIRGHLREFLQTKDEQGNEFFFRFYDPRVLRAYLPTCTAEECRQFFGPVDRYVLEGAEPEQALTFTVGSAGATMAPIALTASAGAPSK
jgi:Domain of unknown function (DUF4123)/FHA domain